MLGVRADITPQAARIDAHSLGKTGATRLCYAGSTLQAVPQTTGVGRSPIQLGAELFGSASIAADTEVITLLLSLLECAGVEAAITLDIGHIGIYDALFSGEALAPEIEQQVFDALQSKSGPDIARWLRYWRLMLQQSLSTWPHYMDPQMCLTVHVTSLKVRQRCSVHWMI